MADDKKKTSRVRINLTGRRKPEAKQPEVYASRVRINLTGKKK